MSDSLSQVIFILNEFKDINLINLVSIDLCDINRKLRKFANKITVRTLMISRIGHLAFNTEDFLRYYAVYGNKLERQRDITLMVTYMPDDAEALLRVCNSQLLRMIKRSYPVIDNPSVINLLILLANDDPELWDLSKGRLFNTNISYMQTFKSVEPQLFFSDEEEYMGQKLLEYMGVGKDKPFICFHNRDDEYLKKVVKGHNTVESTYQNNNIQDLMPAIEYLAKQGYYCIRMGQVTEKTLKIQDERIIDYSNNFRSDFGDIYLLAKCYFFLGGNTGLSCVPWIFNRPSIITNAFPPGIIPYINNCLCIYKKGWHLSEKRFLTYSELLKARVNDWGWDNSNYLKLGVELIQNSSEEILDVVKEMLERLHGLWENINEEISLQNRFLSIFNEDAPGFDVSFIPGFNKIYKKKPLVGTQNIAYSTSKVGTAFLKQNENLLSKKIKDNVSPNQFFLDLKVKNTLEGLVDFRSIAKSDPVLFLHFVSYLFMQHGVRAYKTLVPIFSELNASLNDKEWSELVNLLTGYLEKSDLSFIQKGQYLSLITIFKRGRMFPQKPSQPEFSPHKLYYELTNQWLKIKNQKKSVEDYFIKENIKSVAIYGCGELGKRLFEELRESDIRVICFIDKKIDKNEIFGDTPIQPINTVASFRNVDAIIITPIYHMDIILEELKENKINIRMISLKDIIFSI
ncbi:MAG: TIGR04372 family glycosyltransferase [Clostridia bacterium]|nr:TIGR04372 family glycosyltransferase [Clostridia bacterium]